MWFSDIFGLCRRRESAYCADWMREHLFPRSESTVSGSVLKAACAFIFSSLHLAHCTARAPPEQAQRPDMRTCTAWPSGHSTNWSFITGLRDKCARTLRASERLFFPAGVHNYAVLVHKQTFLTPSAPRNNKGIHGEEWNDSQGNVGCVLGFIISCRPTYMDLEGPNSAGC